MLSTSQAQLKDTTSSSSLMAVAQDQPFHERYFKSRGLESRQKRTKILQTQAYLYRFSLSRLHQFTKDPALTALFAYYFENSVEERIMKSGTMSKNLAVYREAAKNMQNYQRSHFIDKAKILDSPLQLKSQ